MEKQIIKMLKRISTDVDFEYFANINKKKLEESRQEDAIAGYGWGCSNRTWELSLKETAYNIILNILKK